MHIHRSDRPCSKCGNHGFDFAWLSADTVVITCLKCDAKTEYRGVKVEMVKAQTSKPEIAPVLGDKPIRGK